MDLATSYKDHMHSLNDHIKLLKKRIRHLEKKSSDDADIPYINGNNTELQLDDNRLNYKKGLNEQVRFDCD